MHELDSETRKHVEKEMFNQNQKKKGGPSADELAKRDKLKGFMEAHPEIDWANTKVE